MNEIRQAQFELELKGIKDIILFAQESFKISEYLWRRPKSEEEALNPEFQGKKFVINNNSFYQHSVLVNWRTTVIELAKLFSDKKNDDFRLDRFINKLKPSGEYSELKISGSEIAKWEEAIAGLQEAIDNLRTQRDKVYAHSDKDGDAIIYTLTLTQTRNLFEIVYGIIREIYFAVDESSFMFDIAGYDPAFNLQELMAPAIEREKKNFEDLYSLEKEFGLND